jgi:hypothetical protein
MFNPMMIGATLEKVLTGWRIIRSMRTRSQ